MPKFFSVLFFVLFSFTAIAQQNMLSEFGSAEVSGTSTYEPSDAPVVILDQAPNQLNGIFSDCLCAACGSGAQVLADNFVVTTASPTFGITEIVMWGGYFTENIPNTTDDFTITIFEDAAGAPGPVFYTASGLVPTTRVATGVVLFGVDEYVFTFDYSASPIMIPTNGTYHIQISNNSVESGSFFWEVGDLDAVNGIIGQSWAPECFPVTWNYDSVTDMAVQISGIDILPPNINVVPSSFTFDVPVGGSDSDILTIYNTAPAGSQDLNWNIIEQEAILLLQNGETVPISINNIGEERTKLVKTKEIQNGGSSLLNNSGKPEKAGYMQKFKGLQNPAIIGNILLYADDIDGSPGNHYIDIALQELGLTYTAYYDDPTSFGTALTGGGWDLVIIDHNNFFDLGNWWVEVEAYIQTGGKCLITTFDVDGSHSEPTTLWSTIGLSYSADVTLAQPVYWWDAGHPIFNVPESVPEFTGIVPGIYADSGDKVNEINPAESKAGFTPTSTVNEASIIISGVYDVIVNSFLVVENDADLDGDAKPDAVELFKNEIQYLIQSSVDCPWLSENPVSGTIPAGSNQNVDIMVNATGLPVGSYNCNLLILSNDPVDPTVTVPVVLNVNPVVSCSGDAYGNVLCSSFPQGASITIGIEVDMSGINPPDELLGSFTATLDYDPSLLDFTGHSGLQSGFTGVVNVNEPAGLITFNGANPTGMGSVVALLDIDFLVIGPVGNSSNLDLEFSAMAAALTFTDLLPCLTVNDCGFTITPPGFLGDVNDDDLCNSTDALIILSYDVALPIPPAFLARIVAGYGDVNSDTFTNSTDALILLSFDVGIPVPFPVCDPFVPGPAVTVSKGSTKNIDN